MEDFFTYCETISLSEQAQGDDWCLLPLYKYDSNNNIRTWQIGYDSEKNVLLTKAGSQAKPQFYEAEVEAKGKKTLQEQAFQQAKRDHLDKYYEGYKPFNQDDENLPPLARSPMLANEYQPPDENGKTNVKEFPVYVQRKLDGIRLLTYIENGEIRMMSRKSRDFNYSPDHYIELKRELELFFNYLPQRCQLDGELYNHDLTFNQITSIVKTQKFVHTDIDMISYYIFDIIESQDLTYERRYNILINSFQNMITENPNVVISHLKIVESYRVDSYDEIEEKLQEFIDDGYEGLIIRKICLNDDDPKCQKNARYMPRRTSNILKYKQFYEDEMVITDVIECRGNERGLCKLEGDYNGVMITVRPAENFETRQKWLRHKNRIIGQPYTFKYNSINTETGQPRFATGKGLRNYE
jgi:ATP-dependent DNA ligase